MVRTYKRKPGSRRYKDYTTEQLNECITKVRSGILTHKQASELYGISLRTLAYKLKGAHSMKVGKPQTFSTEEEKAFVRCITQLSSYGFPLDELDLKHVVSTYLQKIGRQVKNFKNGCFPGVDWMKSFIKRHPELTSRFVANIKKARAAVDEPMLRDYVNNLRVSLENVPPENIYNYDETNITDDPGLKKCVVKRGSKYPVNIRNTSKTSISVMMAGNAVGDIVPPFVVYKSTCLWNTWVEGGPEGTKYGNTPSGWFDSLMFEKWFVNTMLPILKNKKGTKVLIGDNLSSHINTHVLNLCQKYNIQFICLPPNSTHLTQPLDVSFFGPLKRTWRKVLSDYKDSSTGRNKTSLDKQHFPMLLKTLMDKALVNGKENLVSGFRKCSIYPINVDELLKGINRSSTEESSVPSVEDAFKTYLDNKTAQLFGKDRAQTQRRKKVRVPAGKNITVADMEGEKNSSDVEDTPDDILACDKVPINDVLIDNTRDADNQSPKTGIEMIELVPVPGTSTQYNDSESSKNPFAMSPKKKKRKLLPTVKQSALANKIKSIKKEMSDQKKAETCVKCLLDGPNKLTCDKCRKKYHRSCIPKSYDFVGSDDEDFMCPKCKKQEVNDEDDDSY